MDDLDAHMEKVKANGGKIIVEKMPVPGMGWFCNILDPQNNCFGLWEDDEKAK